MGIIRECFAKKKKKKRKKERKKKMTKKNEEKRKESKLLACSKEKRPMISAGLVPGGKTDTINANG